MQISLEERNELVRQFRNSGEGGIPISKISLARELHLAQKLDRAPNFREEPAVSERSSLADLLRRRFFASTTVWRARVEKPGAVDFGKRGKPMLMTAVFHDVADAPSAN